MSEVMTSDLLDRFVRLLLTTVAHKAIPRLRRSHLKNDVTISVGNFTPLEHSSASTQSPPHERIR
jgi:hypothetical protein